MSALTLTDSFGCASAAVAQLQAYLPSNVDIATHGGTFNLEALKQFTVMAPAVRVATLGFDTPIRVSSGEKDLPVKVAAAIITKDTMSVPRDQAANAIATAIALIIDNNKLGIDNGWPCGEVKGVNEYSGNVQDVGLAIWQVTWTQKIRVGENLFNLAGQLVAGTLNAPDGVIALGATS